MLEEWNKNVVFPKIFACGGHLPAESSASGKRRGSFSALRASTDIPMILNIDELLINIRFLKSILEK